MSFSDYKPIFVLPLFSKLLEKLMHKRLMSYLEWFNLLHKHEFGLQEHKLIEQAFIDLYYDITQATEKKHKACSIFLDFAKVFNTVNHGILLSKLEYYGIKVVLFFGSNLLF